MSTQTFPIVKNDGKFGLDNCPEFGLSISNVIVAIGVPTAHTLSYCWAFIITQQYDISVSRRILFIFIICHDNLIMTPAGSVITRLKHVKIDLHYLLNNAIFALLN